jgi:hypothetical protein
MARIPVGAVGGGGATDPPDPSDVDLTPDPEPEPDPDPPTTPTGSDNPFNDAGSYDDEPDSDPDPAPPEVPQGVQNPFNSDVEDGDIVGADPNSVTEDGSVAGGETLVENDGSLDFNPSGDMTVDPTDADYQSDPGRESGAVESATPDSEITQAFGGDSDEANATVEQATDIIDSASSSANDRYEIMQSGASSAGSWMVYLVLALVGGAVAFAWGEN